MLSRLPVNLNHAPFVFCKVSDMLLTALVACIEQRTSLDDIFALASRGNTVFIPSPWKPPVIPTISKVGRKLTLVPHV